eukprot:COSAG02_NODE_11_length_58539_cov_103.119473_4_plen_101_part_00
MGRDPAMCAGDGLFWVERLVVGFLCVLAAGFSTSTSDGGGTSWAGSLQRPVGLLGKRLKLQAVRLDWNMHAQPSSRADVLKGLDRTFRYMPAISSHWFGT